MERGLLKALSPEVASPMAIPDRKLENDDGDAASSLYSSCGDSEFERYCSANSVMGTPSVCSSTFTVFNDLSEAEFGGSARNLALGLGFEDDGGGLESFSLGGRVDRGGEETRRLAAESGFEMYGGGDEATGFPSEGVENRLMHWKAESVPLRSRDTSELGDGESNKDDGSGDEEVSELERCVANGSRVAEEVEECGLDGSSEKTEDLGDEASSRGDHSEGEDSMYGEDQNSGFNYYNKVDCQMEAKPRDENPLLINSSDAFGLDDWDDFVQESGGIGQPSLLFSLRDTKNREEKGVEVQIVSDSAHSKNSTEHPSTSQTEEAKVARDKPIDFNLVEGDDEFGDFVQSSVAKPGFSEVDEPEGQDDVKNIPVESFRVRAQGDDELMDYSKNFCLDDERLVGLEPLDEEFTDKCGLDDGIEDLLWAKRNSNSVEFRIGTDHGVSEHPGLLLRDPKMKPESTYNSSTNQLSYSSTALSSNRKLNLLEESKLTEPVNLENGATRNPPISERHRSDYPTRVKTEAHELNECYNEVVLDMEEILLTSNESPGARFPQKNRGLHLQSQQSIPLRDGGSSASTSGTDVAYPFAHQPLRIDGVEVIGARQKKGDASFSERLVGVKEYTVYKIRVYSGNDQWEIERRYRDFSTLFRRLKTLFAAQNWVLPAPWITVEKESRKIFGSASPDVVSKRSALIQESLCSILQLRYFTSPPSALTWFLSPQDSLPNSPASSSSVPRSMSFGNRESLSTLGKTISLIVEIHPTKSVKQMLEAQHYSCAGCYKHFDDGKTLIRDFAQTFGWGKPRLCEYTSQLFCSSCHTNETSVLPARVLQNWDFTQYPVSQMAKSYLDSIHDQPMLCVSAVNPFLFSKVPTLLHVMGVRRKIGSILSYVRCPFRGSINRGLGSRRYLLESNDFFALRDLIDLSKGAFAVLPTMVETVLKKMVEHITEQCLVCCDVGIPCSARQACNDPSSLIFPFQEDVGKECPSCKSVFHKACFGKLTDCHCGACLKAGEAAGLVRRISSGPFDFLGKGLTSAGFLSGLFTTKVKPESDHNRDDNNVILMGSLPGNSL